MDASRREELRISALDYLGDVLRDRAPRQVEYLADFSESPLEGEAATALFAFELPVAGQPDCGSGVDSRHIVAVGQTTPNYFPAYGLSPDDLYSLHIGTRFLLEMEIRRADESLEPPYARQRLQQVLDQFSVAARAEDASVAELFCCEEALYVVYRLIIDGEPVFCLGGDCPPGFYPLATHPPQLTLRLHLGKLIRAEARGAASA